MRKNGCRIVLILMIVVIGLACGTTLCAAGSGVQKNAAGLHGSHGTLNDPVVRENQEEYMPNAALVMFKTTKKLKKSRAQATLQSEGEAISDIEIADIWSFETEPVTVASDSGTRKGVKKGGSAACFSSIALVKSKTLTTGQLIKKLRERPDVIYAEPNYRIHACSVNDPYFKQQWSMQGGDAGTSAYNDHTPNVESVWNRGTTGTDRIVAVVDSGVDYTHPDLVNNMWYNTHYPTLKGEFGYDFSAGDDDPMDENGHGTHCAGIIGAEGNNGIGISGVNQHVKIMALRILDEDGSAYLAHEVAAYNYISQAVDLGEPVQAANNSWGGGDYSEIFEELINILGEKGVVSVFAAGNNGADNDDAADYPAYIDSPYLLRVALTTITGKLGSFSNYGKEKVDVAAPGMDILSTVCYDCYNPTIYGSDQAGISAEFNDYESSGGWGSAAMLQSNLYLNGEKYTGGGKPQISVSETGGGFLDEQGHKLQIDLKKMQEGDLVCFTIPYEIAASSEEGPYFSAEAINYGSSDECEIMGFLDVPQGTDLDIGTLGDMYLLAADFAYKDYKDFWTHHFGQTIDKENLKNARKEYKESLEDGGMKDDDTKVLDPSKRELVILIYAYANGNMTVQLDDLGLSRQDLNGTEAFGKYDFMSGTSMAAPYITGAVALQAQSLGTAFGETGADTLVDQIYSMARNEKLPVMSGGGFDFTKQTTEMSPRITDVKVDRSGGKIIITGGGLNPSGGLKVQIGPDDKKMKDAAILSQTDTEVTVRDDGWINNIENIRVTGANGKVVSRTNKFLVNGKKKYTMQGEDRTSGEAMATDGRYIYTVKSSSGKVLKMDSKKMWKKPKRLAAVDPGKLFNTSAGSTEEYAMNFGSDLVYMKGKLYTVVEYGAGDEPESEDDDIWFFSKDGSILAGDAREKGSDMSVYAGDFRLISIDVKSGKVKNLGKLPSDLMKTTDYAMAAYKGRLCFIGGYSFADRGLTKTVKFCDPSKKKGKRWSDGAALPEVRAGGKALQCGGKLVYTVGYSTPVVKNSPVRLPANLIYDGSSWRVSAVPDTKAIEPLLEDSTISRWGKTYPNFTGSVSAVSGGLVYLGMPAVNYGDTFVYDVSADAYRDTGYNFIFGIDDDEIHGIAVKDAVFGFDGESVYRAKLK